MTVTSDTSQKKLSRLRAIASALRARTTTQSGKESASAPELLQFIAEVAGQIEEVIESEPEPHTQLGEAASRQNPHSGPRDFHECLDEVVETRREVLKRLAQ